ncbi:uncharacterized protein N7515_001279 [Penicillium bovifimosum]|uniref:Uncharacterized protein n=1 Tax=Penicillium bovifimosum TaxID=126998 RepID=A0A9W9H9D8_9EURO|nr:uncharacterized protein N7515_001279 [Penicillium bovifimosum]KAJ5142492.1 hypothetical protein N7515_001279 [Penicillium bovifimosum]
MSKELHLNTYMVEQIKDLCILGLYDAKLLYVFQEQFEGWTEQMFKRADTPQFVALLQHDDPEVMPGYSENYLLKTDINPRSEAYPVSLKLKRGGRVTTVEKEEPQGHGIKDGTLRRDHDEIPVKAEIPRATSIPLRPRETTSPTELQQPYDILDDKVRLMLNTYFHLGISPGLGPPDPPRLLVLP